jgi:hypothetical protein
MPRRDKYVSLWVGQADSAASLDEYLKVEFSEDGDVIPSVFAKEFVIKSYDEDFREARVWDVPSCSLRDLLTGFSYDDIIIPKFTKLCGPSLASDANTVIVLYNFEYAEGRQEGIGSSVKVRYLGTVKLDTL